MAIKTSELENLATATASLLSTISDKLQPTGTLDLSQVIYYSLNNGLKLNYDMYKTLKMNTAAADFNAWVPAFEKAVPYYRMSARWYSIYIHKPMTEVFDGISSDHRVLSMFFPGKQYNNVYPTLRIRFCLLSMYAEGFLLENFLGLGSVAAIRAHWAFVKSLASVLKCSSATAWAP